MKLSLSQPDTITFVRCFLCDELIGMSEAICSNCLHDFISNEAYLAWQDILLRPDANKMLTVSAIAHIYCLSEHVEPIRHLITQVKYQQNVFAKATLSKLICAEASLLPNFDYLVPVPMHWLRFCKRGFNQAEWIADIIAELMNQEAIHLLKRTRYTRQQAKLNSARRAKNLVNAFKAVNVEMIQGKHITLVDDVVTTGATLQALATCLKKAGASEVSAIVVSWAKLD